MGVAFDYGARIPQSANCSLLVRACPSHYPLHVTKLIRHVLHQHLHRIDTGRSDGIKTTKSTKLVNGARYLVSDSCTGVSLHQSPCLNNGLQSAYSNGKPNSTTFIVPSGPIAVFALFGASSLLSSGTTPAFNPLMINGCLSVMLDGISPALIFADLVDCINLLFGSCSGTGVDGEE